MRLELNQPTLPKNEKHRRIVQGLRPKYKGSCNQRVAKMRLEIGESF